MSLAADMFAGLFAHLKVEGDTENNAIVDAFALALGDVFERLTLIAFGDPVAGVRGEQYLRDPSVAPIWSLAHAALYTGARLPSRKSTEGDAEYLARARDAAVYPLGIRRGTHEAVRRAIRSELTGMKTVVIVDNYNEPYGIFVRTFVDETPDPARVQKLLEGDFVSSGEPGAIRAELMLSYVVADQPAWAEPTLRWNEVAADVDWETATSEDLT